MLSDLPFVVSLSNHERKIDVNQQIFYVTGIKGINADMIKNKTRSCSG